MSNAKIYRKTIASSVQDGIDQSLILGPNTFYQKKFNFGDEWNEIRIGMFLSYTNSATNDNLNFSASSGITSGTTSNDTYNWFGIIKDMPTKYLPNMQPLLTNQLFSGCRFSRLQNISTDSSHGNTLLHDNNRLSIDGNVHGPNLATSNEYEYQSAIPNSSAKFRVWIPFTKAANTTTFAGTFILNFKILNKGLSDQMIQINNVLHGGASQGEEITDVSISNLLTLMNTLTNNDYTGTFNLNNGVSALPIPDSVFFYNAFLNVRPRIHAIAAKKIN